MKKLDGKDLKQELIKSWGVVDLKENYELKLHVAKRKNTTGATKAAPSVLADPPSLETSTKSLSYQKLQ